MKTNLPALLFALWATIIFCTCCNASPYTTGTDIVFSEQDSIQFLVENSDLIAIIYVAEGTKKRLPWFAFKKALSVNANILQIIKGTSETKDIKISSETRFPAPNAIKNQVMIRSGRHLVFLCKGSNSYSPTTRFSMLDISDNRVYPIWEQKQNPQDEFTDGQPLVKIIADIKSILHQFN